MGREHRVHVIAVSTPCSQLVQPIPLIIATVVRARTSGGKVSSVCLSSSSTLSHRQGSGGGPSSVVVVMRNSIALFAFFRGRMSMVGVNIVLWQRRFPYSIKMGLEGSIVRNVL